MKLSKNEFIDGVTIETDTTEKNTRIEHYPAKNIHYWYPFNTNFFYKYSESKGFMYLVKEKDYDGENYYDVKILKKSKPLVQQGMVPYHQKVFERNVYIMSLASSIGIVPINKNYTAEDVVYGFETLARVIEALKNRIYKRTFGFSEFAQSLHTEGWDEEIYKRMTEEETEIMIEFGEIYAMLSVMRKLA